MLAAAERREFDTPLLWNQSRLGRNQPEVDRARRRVEFHRLCVVTLDGYDTSGSFLKNRKLIRVVEGAMEEGYLDDLHEDVLRGVEGQYGKGYWCDGRPYGYKLVAEMRSGKRDLLPAEVEELDKRIARLREGLKGGEPDPTAEELLANARKHRPSAPS